MSIEKLSWYSLFEIHKEIYCQSHNAGIETPCKQVENLRTINNMLHCITQNGEVKSKFCQRIEKRGNGEFLCFLTLKTNYAKWGTYGGLDHRNTNVFFVVHRKKITKVSRFYHFTDNQAKTYSMTFWHPLFHRKGIEMQVFNRSIPNSLLLLYTFLFIRKPSHKPGRIFLTSGD